MDSKALLVVYVVVGARLLLPLLIPRFPLFGIVACLALDSADQSIMQALGIDPPWYQGYDKALDIYYLSIAYIATMRNWENLAAFHVSRVLFYLRLIGVLTFELTGLRLLLLIFPNAFEPFFVYYELVRRKGDPMHLTRSVLILLVAAIWFVVKLPHEWWVHVAQFDGTDFVKTKILGASLDTPLWRAIIEAPVITGALTVGAALAALAVWRSVEAWSRRMPKVGASGLVGNSWVAHWRRPTATKGAAYAGDLSSYPGNGTEIAGLRGRNASSIRSKVLVEKIVLVTIVSLIFQQVLPGLEANGVQTALFIAVTIVATDFLLRWVVRRFGAPISAKVDLLLIALLNFGFVLVFQLIVPIVPPQYNLGSALVFASLVTLFVTLYDHYRPAYDVRRVKVPGAAEDLSLSPAGLGRTQDLAADGALRPE